MKKLLYVPSVLLCALAICSNSFAGNNCESEKQLVATLKKQNSIAKQQVEGLDKNSKVTLTGAAPMGFLATVIGASFAKLSPTAMGSLAVAEVATNILDIAAFEMSASQYKRLVDLSNQTIAQLDSDISQNTCAGDQNYSPSAQAQFEQIGAALDNLNRASIELSDKIAAANLEGSYQITIYSTGASFVALLVSATLPSYKAASTAAIAMAVAGGVATINSDVAAIRVVISAREAKAYLQAFNSATTSLIKQQQALSAIAKSQALLK